MRHLTKLVAVAVAIACLAAIWPPAFAQAAGAQPSGAQPLVPGLDDFAGKVPVGELVPGADRLGPTREPLAVAPAYRGNDLVGYVYLNSQQVDAAGYSSKPIHVLVGLDRDGTIVGAKLVAHSEPIVLIGIPERRVAEYLSAFVGYNPVRASAEGRAPPHADIVSGATVTVLVMGESVTRSALRVARALGLGASAAGAVQAAGAGPSADAGRPAARVLDPGAGVVADWKALLDSGAVGRLRVTVGQVNQAFADSGNAAAAARPQAGAPGDNFVDLYAALVSQPAIGRSLLGEAEYASVAQKLAPGQQAILVAGEGLYSFKGSGYVRGGIFDRIELVQGAETIRFRDRQHRRVGALQAAGAPALHEIGVFLIPEGSEFDPTRPWRLQLLVQRSTGALDKAFVSFDLAYRLPPSYTKPAMAAPAAQAAAPAQPAEAARAPSAPAAGAAETAGRGTAAAAAVGTVQPEEPAPTPLWQRIWRGKAVSIAVLAAMLAALTLIFFFQDALVRRETLYGRVRLAFLAVTLVWLGWGVQAQLSVVNVLTFTTALRAGFQWSSFLVDPLVFILWCSVAAALLFWGRGPFCGWLCPFGALQELSNRAARALKVPQVRIAWAVHERLWPIKYVVFLGLFGVSLGSLATAEVLSEVEPFKTAIVLRFMRQWGFVAFALALVGAGLFVERFFCRYLCPLGAALAIPGRLRMFDWLRRYRECGNPCQRCAQECPVEAIHPEGHINPNECIGCLHCQVLYQHERKCPVQIQRRIKREKREAMGRPVVPIVPVPARAPAAQAPADPA